MAVSQNGSDIDVLAAFGDREHDNGPPDFGVSTPTAAARLTRPDANTYPHFSDACRRATMADEAGR